MQKQVKNNMLLVKPLKLPGSLFVLNYNQEQNQRDYNLSNNFQTNFHIQRMTFSVLT